MTVTLCLRKEFRVSVNARCLSPDIFAGKSLSEIATLEIWEGNRKHSLSDFFEIEGNCGSTSGEVAIHLVGDLSKVHRIGAGMTGGEVKIQGHVGMHLGEEMRNGTITVEGNAGSWLGSVMNDGTIEVKGNAGDYVGGIYRGSTKGMRGGTIIVYGNAGTEVGCYMRNGLIKIHGNVDQFVGIHMKHGTIVVHGRAEERAGAYMTGGKVVLCNYTPSVLPTFTIDSIKRKAKVDGEEIQGPFYLFIGDLTEHGEGKLYVSKNHNEHLSKYEQLL